MAKDDIVSAKTVVAVLGAAIAGAIGGATLTSPAPARDANVDLYAHVIRLQRSTEAGPPHLLTYATGVFRRADGGLKKRDLGEASCPAADPALLSKAMAALASDCKAPQGSWPHVVEVRGNGADGGWNVDVYSSKTLSDGGQADLGLVACRSAAPDVAELLNKEAIRCAEVALDDP